MRHKTNEFLKRLQLARPEMKKNFRRGISNPGGRRSEKKSIFLTLSIVGDASAGVE